MFCNIDKIEVHCKKNLINDTTKHDVKRTWLIFAGVKSTEHTGASVSGRRSNWLEPWCRNDPILFKPYNRPTFATETTDETMQQLLAHHVLMEKLVVCVMIQLDCVRMCILFAYLSCLLLVCFSLGTITNHSPTRCYFSLMKCFHHYSLTRIGFKSQFNH